MSPKNYGKIVRKKIEIFKKRQIAKGSSFLDAESAVAEGGQLNVAIPRRLCEMLHHYKQ